MNIEDRLNQLGIKIPDVPRPVAAYVAGTTAGDLVYTSGQLPILGGELLYRGKVGIDLDVEQGKAAARQAVLNCLGVVKSLAGSLDRVEGIIKMTGYIQSGEDFDKHPQVLNGASELLEKIFGERGRHARVAVGVNSLPLNAACEIELVVRVKT